MPARNPQWRWILVTCVLVIAVVSLAAVVIHQSVSSSSDDDVDETDMDSVIRKYGHLFVSMDEYQPNFQARTGDGLSVVIPMCVTEPRLVASTTSNGNSTALSQAGTCTDTIRLHGCCNSSVTFFSPTEATNIYSERVKVVQYPPRYVQTFSTESCLQVEGCISTCKCAKVISYATAVIRGPKGVTTTIIQYEGCCKCLNVGYFKP